MSTEFAISRFLVPFLTQDRYALFMDGDVLVRDDVSELEQIAFTDPTKALWCVQHNHRPSNFIKKREQAQSRYSRKNWSSVMLFDLEHPANKRLTVEMVNALPGRDLHQFCWLKDDEIGALPATWNYLVGHTRNVREPKIVHYTEGTPDTPGHESDEFAEEWWRYGNQVSGALGHRRHGAAGADGGYHAPAGRPAATVS